ncbi:MAG TPA: hypothetical protein VFK11_00225 [Candidatus Saccharimonadales bacterium]|nr:hypothetical protein [Candidatus Saccharimonadales bacterium]
MDAKKIFRGIALYLLGTFLFFVLFGFAYFLAFTQMAGNPDRVKQALYNSGLYEKAGPVLYDNFQESEGSKGPEQDIPLKDPIVRQAVLSAFSPSFIQKSVENVIDGTYGWLNGDTAQPEFSINLAEAQKNFSQTLGDEITERLKKLPRCSAEQVQKAKKTDPFSIRCLPPGVSIKSLRKQVVKEAEGGDVLEKKKITASDLKSKDGGGTFSDSSAPSAYRTALKVPYILLVLGVLLGTGLVYASSSRKNGLKRLGKILAIAAVFALFVPIAFNILFSILLKADTGDNIITDLAVPVIREFNKAGSKFYYITGAGYALLAVGAFYLAKRLPAEGDKRKK